MKSMNDLYKPFQPTLTDSGLKSFGLSLKQAPVSKALTGIVHSYLQVTTTKPTPYPIIPDGTQAFFMSPLGIKIGVINKHAFDLQLLQRGEYFGVRFNPGALRCFLDIDLSEFSEQIVNTDQLVGSFQFPVGQIPSIL